MSAAFRRHSDSEHYREKSPLMRGKRSPAPPTGDAEYGSLPMTSEFLRDKERGMNSAANGSSLDDFGDDQALNAFGGQQHKNIKSGRQRKKIASRTKGGEFQARRRKRRLYFCCISSEIDIDPVAERFQQTFMGLKGRKYDEVLHLYTERTADVLIGTNANTSAKGPQSPPNDYSRYIDPGHYATDSEAQFYAPNELDSTKGGGFHMELRETYMVDVSAGGREVFVFDFGAVVFWGCSREEANDLLSVFREHVTRRLSQTEFEAGEDDMAFVTTDTDSITIANDVILLPEHSTVQQRLAVSFAIAQSAVLAIFEDRIEFRIEEYKFIPEELAASGRVNLTPQQLGGMIGEVFVIRHDVNLHSEILDIPDYFWKANAVEPLYRMATKYLEMEPRTEVLNKRLDLLQELLRLVQHQHENAHNIKLEWIVIWLIVISVILEMYASLGEYFHWPVVTRWNS